MNFQNNRILEKRIQKSPYLRPKYTLTDLTQTKKKILKKLDGYKEDEVDNIPIGTHVRYIVYQSGKSKFRLGGFLKLVKDEYVVLSNGRISWSVQRYARNKCNAIIHRTRFFRLLSALDKYKKEQAKKDKLIEKQQKELKKLKQLLKSKKLK